MTRCIWFRPFKTTFLQSVIIKPKTISIPKQDLNFVSAAVTEDKPDFTERIHFQHISHNQLQAINRLAHISYARDQVNTQFGVNTSEPVTSFGFGVLAC